MGIIVVFTFLLYGNIIKNYYNLDDNYINSEKSELHQGVSVIPWILGSRYATAGEKSYGYRPITRISFAMEYSLFRLFGIPSKVDPYVSHFFNLLYYLIGVLLLFKVLRRLFRNMHPIFPLVVTLLFIAHPVHTEVVNSLKNRDELFVLIFSLWSLWLFLKYADTDKIKFAIWGGIIYMLAFLAKPTAASFFFIIPLSLYFFTELKTKKVIYIGLGLLAFALIAAFGPFLYLPNLQRPLRLDENPLVMDPHFMDRIPYAFYILYYYMRLLVIPHPLLYYYGYNMIPLVGFGNIYVILSIIFHLGIFAFAIWKIREKHILAFAILVYLTSIAMFTNIVRPAPGIIAERFLFIPSLGFVIALAYFLFKMFLVSPSKKTLPTSKLVFILTVMIIILIPYSAKTYTRNFDWRNSYTLYSSDMPLLYNSAKANDLYATEIMTAVNKEMAKPVNVLKFVKPRIQEAISHYERVTEIDPSYASAYNNIGVIYSRIFKKYDTAIIYFNKALKYKPDDPMTYFYLGQSYENKGEYARAIDDYNKSLALDSTAINTRSRLANVYYGLGEFKKAVSMNEEIMRIAPGESLPYANIGNYYFFQKDTVNAIKFYERAVELGAPAVASEFLSKYYASKGDQRKSNYYKKIAGDLQKKQENE